MADRNIETSPDPGEFSWEETLSKYPFIARLSEEAKGGWNSLSSEVKALHIKGMEEHVAKNYASLRIGSGWQTVEGPAMGRLPSEMLLRMLEDKGCEVKKDENSPTGWVFRKK